MKKVTYYCDRCKVEIPDGHLTQANEFDLCPDCAANMEILIADWVKRGPQKGFIDWGKAQALRDAGWTLEATAKEIGSTVSSVMRNTKKPKAKKIYEHETAENDPAILKSPELV